MTIVKTEDYLESLKSVLRYIAKDNKSATFTFRQALDIKINNLKDFPFMYRVSIYFDDEYIRDMTHKGYTIPYEVDLEK